MEQLKKRAANLLSVKSIVTVALTAIFAVLALRRDISGENFLTIFLMVISFYFGTQSQKVQEAIDKGANGGPAQARQSGLRGERTSTGISELSASAGSEEYGGCEDDE